MKKDCLLLQRQHLHHAIPDLIGTGSPGPLAGPWRRGIYVVLSNQAGGLGPWDSPFETH